MPHPLGVTASQVVVDRDKMDAFPGQRVQVHRQGSDQRFTFTGLHLGNFALVEDDTTDQLHVVVAHLDPAPTRFTNYGKRLGQQIFKCLACPVAFYHLWNKLIHLLGFDGDYLGLQVL